ncbi:MAG: hypothetical protein E6K69_07570 [Nitrospirae bacterium]|nr:MAG: hypothetical protein E6K69_07570 [Nitrospirota bacterium]
MARRTLSAWMVLTTLLVSTAAFAENLKVIVAEASYVMGDADTLAWAENNVLLKAKRMAVEEAGVYIEASSQDVETISRGKTSRTNSLGVRTIAAAVTATEVLETRRSLENDRLVFYVKIRATIEMDKLEAAIKRLKSDEQLAIHDRQLQAENSELKTQLDRLQKQLHDSSLSQNEPTQELRNRRLASELAQSAIRTLNLPEKINLASQAIAADDRYVDAYIIRGQTYLRIASLAFSNKNKRTEQNSYAERALSDFDRAATLDPASAWALLGRGDAYTWQRKMQEAAGDYERVLQLDPLFDVARQRLITLYTTLARKQTAAKQWRQALATLDKLLGMETAQSWIVHQKEAYLLRSQIYVQLGELGRAVDDLSTVVRVDPTNIQAFLLRAKLYQRQMQGRLAKDDFERACVLGSEEACIASQ